MTFTETSSSETVALVQNLDTEQIEAMAAGHRRGPRARRPAVHPRRRRLGRPRQPRGQRLPQDLRLRGLLAHRQRLRAHRAGQRRGLGHHFSEWLKGSRLGADDAVLVFSVGGGNAREERLDQHRGARSTLARRARRARSSASSAATAATPRSSPTPASIIPPLSPDHITPHTEGLCAVVWHLLVSHPALAARRDQVGVDRVTRPAAAAVLHRRRRRLHRQPLRRRAARRPGDASGHGLRQLLLRAATGTYEPISGRPAADRRPRRRRRPRRARPRPWTATTWSSTWPRTPTSPRAVDRTRRSTSTRARC